MFVFGALAFIIVAAVAVPSDILVVKSVHSSYTAIEIKNSLKENISVSRFHRIGTVCRNCIAEKSRALFCLWAGIQNIENSVG